MLQKSYKSHLKTDSNQDFLPDLDEIPDETLASRLPNQQEVQPPSQQPSQQPENQSPNLQESVPATPQTTSTTVELPNTPVIESERLVHTTNIQIHFYLQYLGYITIKIY